jgi:hypothetical protein
MRITPKSEEKKAKVSADNNFERRGFGLNTRQVGKWQLEISSLIAVLAIPNST